MSGSSKTIDFIIDTFNTEITLDICGNLLNEPFLSSSIDVSCVADLYVDASLVRSAFQFQTDASDMINIFTTDIKYFNNREFFWNYDPLHSFSINPGDAVVNHMDTTFKIMDSSFEPTKNMVCHDFVRYLSEKLFNTPYGVDLFNNELELLNDIRLKLRKVWYTIDNQLIKYDVQVRMNANSTSVPDFEYDDQTGYDGVYGPNKWLYCLNGIDHLNNVSRKLLLQMAHYNPDRLQNIKNTTDIQPIPFIGGDTISLKLNIKPAAGQENLTGVSAFGARTFRIRFNLVEDHISSHILEQQRDSNEYNSHRYFIPPIVV